MQLLGELFDDISLEIDKEIQHKQDEIHSLEELLTNIEEILETIFSIDPSSDISWEVDDSNIELQLLLCILSKLEFKSEFVDRLVQDSDEKHRIMTKCNNHFYIYGYNLRLHFMLT